MMDMKAIDKNSNSLLRYLTYVTTTLTILL